ncbi:MULTISPECIES: RNA-binding S4 domain-containing protein [Hyphobacterium]|uniref:RNA-binding S4 domain-containing protein n=1 Tax=Hyphobacterium vulgare TaxID=1736751 RepID=A0ABV6ZY17_9PROT
MSETAGIRVDVWLWRARFFKSRTMATRFVETGSVRLGRAGHTSRVEKASALVRPGDVLTLSLPSGVRQLRIAALGARRGPPDEARALYETTAPGVGKTHA